MKFDIHSLRAHLTQNGFAESASGGEGTLSKTIRIDVMPYAAEHIVDDVDINLGDEVLVRVTPDNFLFMEVLKTDYKEGPIPIMTMPGYGILVDAGVPDLDLEDFPDQVS